MRILRSLLFPVVGVPIKNLQKRIQTVVHEFVSSRFDSARKSLYQMKVVFVPCTFEGCKISKSTTVACGVHVIAMIQSHSYLCVKCHFIRFQCCSCNN